MMYGLQMGVIVMLEKGRQFSGPIIGFYLKKGIHINTKLIEGVNYGYECIRGL
jgi:hypothetical protein